MTWSHALDFCQSAGMQAVALGDDKSDEDISAILSKLVDPAYGMASFWTSGYVSHPSKEAAAGDDPPPPSVMWASTTMTKTEEVSPGLGFWASDGLSGRPQPDNFAALAGGRDEECVAAARDAASAEGDPAAAGDRPATVGLHDLGCDKLKPVVCEEREETPAGAAGLNIYM